MHFLLSIFYDRFPDAKYYDMNTWKQPYRNFWDVLEYEEKN